MTASARTRLLCALILCCALLAGCGGGAQTARQQAPSFTLVVLGASDAWGYGTNDPDRRNWPIEMANDLEQPVHLINLGVPGATLGQAEQQELPVALDARPRVVVIWLAVNDIIANVPLPTYTAELHATLGAFARESPQTQVYVGNVPDLTQLPYFAQDDPTALRAQILAWNSAIAQACAVTGANVVDLYQRWNNLSDHPDYISADGLHPSQRGADELAGIFSSAILISDTNLG